MAIYQTAYYQVKPEAVEACKQAIREFVDYVKANEPGTEMYVAWQQKDDPTCFVHFFKFADQEAQDIHSSSAAVKKFESVYSPVLVSNGVTFTDYQMIAAKNV